MRRQQAQSRRQTDDITNNDNRSGTSLSLLNTPTSPRNLSRDDDYLLQEQSMNRITRQSFNEHYLTGWRIGALLSLIGAVFVFVFNLVITIWVWKNPQNEIEGAVGTMYRGNCAKVRSLNIWIHLLVNVLSTLLLVASNYCMQVLSAPNRGELNIAHAQRRWMHVGVPNLRNLRYIGRNRLMIYVGLFVSSVPLHLFFNSVVFTNLQANNYAVIPTTEDWLQGAPYNTSGFVDISAPQTNETIKNVSLYAINSTEETNTGRYKSINAEECFSTFNNQYLSDVGNVYIIQEKPPVFRDPSLWWLNGADWTRNNITSKYVYHGTTIPFLSKPDTYPSNGWQCPSRNSSTCNVDDEREVPQNRSNWEPYESPVKYCLVEQVEETCKLQFSFAIAMLVIAANLVKAICMALTVRTCRQHTALVTIGDAIATFLDTPDPETTGRCLQTRRHVELWWDYNEWAEKNPDAALRKDRRRFRLRRRRWAMAPSEMRWVSTYWAYGATFVLAVPCIYNSLEGMPSDPKKLWQTGFGAVKGNNLLNFRTSLLGGVLLANTPQALLSYMYLAFNALYTTMFVAAEWSSYIVERKTVRVTAPVGQQRDTYWLGVPFRYAIPMTCISGLFHWLASQSLFKVQISITDAHTRQVIDEISTCGYSPVAIILTTSVAFMIAGGGVLVSRLWYPAGIPLAGSNSAAISAACHPPPEDVDASVLPVQWGAVTHGEEGRHGREAVGHCCFTSFPVEMPIPGRMYK